MYQVQEQQNHFEEHIFCQAPCPVERRTSGRLLLANRSSLHNYATFLSDTVLQDSCEVDDRVPVSFFITMHHSNLVLFAANSLRATLAKTIPGLVVLTSSSKLMKASLAKLKYNRVDGAAVSAWRRTNRRTQGISVVDDRSGETILPIIQQHVAPGFIIHTDCARVYYALERLVLDGPRI